MTLITQTLISDGTTIDASDVNTPISTIYNDYNGNITNANISATAAIAGTKIADASIAISKMIVTDFKTKILNSTRNASAASGDVAYTGVGFKPNYLRCLLVMDGTVYTSDGSSAVDKGNSCVYTSAAGTFYSNTSAIASYSNQSSWAQSALVKSYDADGFTLTWAKIGTPTAGTFRLMSICGQ